MAGGNDIDDFVQEAFVKAWKARKQFKGESSEKTWVARITINTVIDSLRKQKEPSIEFNETIHLNSAGDNRHCVETRDLVTKALLSLGEPFKSAFILVIVEGFSTKEAALALDVEEGTVRSRVSRARSLLKEFLRSKGVNYGSG